MTTVNIEKAAETGPTINSIPVGTFFSLKMFPKTLMHKGTDNTYVVLRDTVGTPTGFSISTISKTDKSQVTPYEVATFAHA